MEAVFASLALRDTIQTMKIDRADETTMTAEEFLAWAETWADGERYELVESHPVRLHNRRTVADGEIVTAILGQDADIDPTTLGLKVTVDALLTA